MIYVLAVLLGLGQTPKEEYNAEQRRNDSLLIYNSYQAQLKMLTSLNEADIQLYYNYEAYVDSLTACAKLRLKKYNKQSYEPAGQFDRQGVGMTFIYPNPSAKETKPADDFVRNEPTRIKEGHYIIYDKQTRFITDKDGKSIPYINRMVYEKGRLITTEKINPVTLEKLYSSNLDWFCAILAKIACSYPALLTIFCGKGLEVWM